LSPDFAWLLHYSQLSDQSSQLIHLGLHPTLHIGNGNSVWHILKIIPQLYDVLAQLKILGQEA
jgi:hypothetical protein